MNTVVFSILRLCPPVPLCGGSSRYQLGSLGAVAGSQLVGGNPDFTDAPAHGGDDARFYDR